MYQTNQCIIDMSIQEHLKIKSDNVYKNTYVSESVTNCLLNHGVNIYFKCLSVPL